MKVDLKNSLTDFKMNADILLDLQNPEIYWHWKIFVTDPFMQGAIGMLKLISEDNGWEESELHYFEQFITKYKSLIENKIDL